MSHRHFIREYVRSHLHQLVILAEREFDIPSVMTNTSHSNTTNRNKSNNVPCIATHNGHFHCDEALACALLRHTKAFGGSELVRTRDPAIIEACDVVVDVGAVYDVQRRRFDHHQSSFTETMRTSKKLYSTRLSSAGLVYRHYGREIIQNFLEAALGSSARKVFIKMAGWNEEEVADRVKGNFNEELELIFDAVYATFVEEIDGIDNGVEPYTVGKNEEAPQEGLEVVKRYLQSTSLSDRVGRLNISWNEEEEDTPNNDKNNNNNNNNNNSVREHGRFAEAMELTIMEFFEAVFNCVFVWLPARTIVEEAFHAAPATHSSGKILSLRRFCPWKSHLFAIEEEQHVDGSVLFVLYPDKGGWRVQAVPKKTVGFENRVPLQYRGLRDEELSRQSGIDGGVFVHVSGFVGGMKTYEGALQLAIKSLPSSSSP